jgi:hypothetical protein
MLLHAPQVLDAPHTSSVVASSAVAADRVRLRYAERCCPQHGCQRVGGWHESRCPKSDQRCGWQRPVHPECRPLRCWYTGCRRQKRRGGWHGRRECPGLVYISPNVNACLAHVNGEIGGSIQTPAAPSSQPISPRAVAVKGLNPPGFRRSRPLTAASTAEESGTFMGPISLFRLGRSRRSRCPDAYRSRQRAREVRRSVQPQRQPRWRVALQWPAQRPQGPPAGHRDPPPMAATARA